MKDSNVSSEVINTQLLVLGGGPGGYTAAFRAADLGMQVTIVEQRSSLGGTCLNVGCIPSKALLHAAKIINETKSAAKIGIKFIQPEINIDKLRTWKERQVKKLSGGLSSLAKHRDVKIIYGRGEFISPNELKVQQEDGVQHIQFEKAVIAAGSRNTKIPGVPYDDPRIIDSTKALEINDIPEKLLVIGGGIIGLEIATIYRALGARITLVELTDNILKGCDRDIYKPLERTIKRQFEEVLLQTKVTEINFRDKTLIISFDGDKPPKNHEFDKVLIAVGRTPNSDCLGIENVGIATDNQGYIKVDTTFTTSQPNIYAIGDIIGRPMLAHKAVHEGKNVAETIAGKSEPTELGVIPVVIYTDPEIAWVGITEDQAINDGIDYKMGDFPWAANGRAVSMGCNEGVTKILVDKKTNKIIGGAIVGANAGELISEIALAIDAGLTADDIAKTIHPHPTLSETIALTAEMLNGTITDLLCKTD